MKRIISTPVLALASFLLVATTAQARPATLTGERLTAGGPGISEACPTAGATISGTATGPYPGTFTETFSFAFTQFIGLGAWGPPGTLTASFEIVSGSTTITGTKSATEVSGVCDVGATQTPATVFSGHAQGPYEATIATPEGVFSDRGEDEDDEDDSESGERFVDRGSAVTDLSNLLTGPDTTVYTFEETFTSARKPKDRCKEGDRRNFRKSKHRRHCKRSERDR